MAGQVLLDVPEAERAAALGLLTLLSGAAMVLFGLLGLGRLSRFVSYSVMSGFLIGIAVLTALSQVPTIAGYDPGDPNRVLRALRILASPGRVEPQALAVGALTLALAVGLARTRLALLGSLLAVAIPSALAPLMGWDRVEVVADVGEIGGGLPRPALPDFGLLSVPMLSGAMAIALVVLLQAAGVSQGVPNPDDRRSSLSRDFVGQGLATAASGLVRGLPVGGSLGATALSGALGARSRWAAVFLSLWTLVAVLGLPGFITRTSMPALAGLLVYAAVAAIAIPTARSIWRTGVASWVPAVATFAATLALPLHLAVAIGVVLSAALTLHAGGEAVALVRLEPTPEGLVERGPAPTALGPGEALILDVQGGVTFAGARALEERLPQPGSGEGAARGAAVILRLHGHPALGATLIEVLDTYAEALDRAGARLILAEIGEAAARQLRRTQKIGVDDGATVVRAEPLLDAATHRAWREVAVAG